MNTGTPGRGRARGRAKPLTGPISSSSGLPNPGLTNGTGVSSSPPATESSVVPVNAGQFEDAIRAKPNCSTTWSQKAKRPGIGQQSIKKITLYANYFELELPHGFVYQYDVQISNKPKDSPQNLKSQRKPRTSNRLPERVTKHVFQRLVADNAIFAKHKPVYDGNKTLVTRYPLDDIVKSKNFEVCVMEEGRKSIFLVNVKPALTQYGERGEVDLEPLHLFIKQRKGELPLDSLRVMDLIFRHGPSMQLVPVGRSFFIKPNKDEDLPPFGGGREIWFGYTQSVRPTEWKPMLNVDLTATVFYKEGPIMNFVAQALGMSQPLSNKALDAHTIRKISKEISGLRVRTTHSAIPRRYTIAGLSRQSSSEHKFELENPNGQKREITVEKYFLEQYKYQLKFPNLQCLQVQPKEKGTHIPMEVCTMLSEQHCKRRLTEVQTASMIKKTCKSPQIRFQEIKKRLEETRKHCAPYLEHFGINLGRDLVEVESRVLKPPVVVYQQPDCFTPNQGFWNIADHRFFRGVQIDSWVMLNYGNCSLQDLEKFCNMLQKEGNRLGMQIAPPKYIKDLRNERRLGPEEILRRSKQMYPDLQLAVMSIPGRSDMSNYSEIKKAGDTELGLVTQCIKDGNLSRKCNPSLLGNLCQKINAKLGGINNTVTPEKPFKQPSIFQEPILVLGADVTHPAPGDNSPSIAAVVGSLDRYPSRFAARVRVQKSTLGGIQSRVEMIQDLKDMVQSLLRQFFKETRQKPQRLLFYRDGVSETQFPEVLHYEVAQIREACRAMNPDYKPALTFLCVQKRHRTRFCPKRLSDACGKAGNIPPGTTVDTGIVSPVDFDFFLCSHFGLQGTSRPTHYSVLLDENNMSADQVQAVSYALCHTYVRCTRSLSIPAPVQYAHLAAFRARSHISNIMDFSSGSSSNGSEPSYDNNSSIIERAVQVVEGLQNQMYFV